MNRRKEKIAKAGFLLPGLIVYLAIIIIPACYTIYLSFFQWKGGTSSKLFVGLSNYINTFKDPNFYNAIFNNLKWIFLSLFVTVTVALLMALLLNKRFKGRTIFRGIFYFPYILSGVVVGIVWQWIYQPNFGLLVSIGKALNIDFLTTPFLAQKNTALIAAFVASLWQTFGSPMILFLSGLQTIPSDIIEAADIDGAGKIRKLFYVTIPMLKETFVIVLATQIIAAMLVYDVIITLAGDGMARSTTVMSVLMMTQSFRSAELGMGSATAVLMVLMLSVVIVPYISYMAKEDGGK